MNPGSKPQNRSCVTRGLAARGRQCHLELCCRPDTALSSLTPFSHNWGRICATGFCWLRFLALKLMVTSRVKSNTVSSGPWGPTQNLDCAWRSRSAQ